MDGMISIRLGHLAVDLGAVRFHTCRDCGGTLPLLIGITTTIMVT
jgi:hypothetical protein